MPQQTKSTIRDWFKRGKKPLQTQFYDWLDSFWHKDELIPQNKVDGLVGALSAGAFKPVIVTAEDDYSLEVPENRTMMMLRIEPTNESFISVIVEGTTIIDKEKVTAGGKFVAQIAAYDPQLVTVTGITSVTNIFFYFV